MAFRKLLTEPLTELTEQLENLEIDELEGQHIEIETEEHNELKVMEQSFNKLIDKVVQYRKELEHTQKELIISNEKLDHHNIQLEQDVARKTSNLSQAMMELQQQKYELEKQKIVLTEEIDLRRSTEQELITKQTESHHIMIITLFCKTVCFSFSLLCFLVLFGLMLTAHTQI